MTLVNIASGAVYTKGLPARDKVQAYGMSIVFLVLLYNSSAGLVLYWTCNNIFSLVKNCVEKIKLSKKILLFIIITAAALFSVYVLFFHVGMIYKRLLAASAAIILLAFILFINSIKKFYRKIVKIINSRNTAVISTQIFLSSALSLFLLSGLVIPSTLIASSVEEFSFIEPYKSPFPFIGTTMLQAAGFFLFWFSAIYFFFSKNTKSVFALSLYILSAAALINTFAFVGDYGFLDTILVFSDPRNLNFNPLPFIFNLFTLACVAALCVLLALSKRKTVFYSIQAALIISLTAIGIVNFIKIKTDFSNMDSDNSEKMGAASYSSNVSKPVYYFSRTGRNVIVIMLDRAISGYTPYIFEERPDLQESFSGFTWYPNCVSLGAQTLHGVPQLFGGYDYTPYKIQEQDGSPLVKKWNESLLVLPRLFSENGFYVTVTDPPLVNFDPPGDLSIYNAYPNIHAEYLHGKFIESCMRKYPDTKLLDLSGLLKYKLMRFSFFRMSPFLFRKIIYDYGTWMDMSRFTPGNDGVTVTTIDNYSKLDALPEITKIDDVYINTYTAIENDLTHEPAFFQAPDYIPSDRVTNFGSSPFADENQYHATMAALVLLGKWFDYLKQNKVYDNTRIIISSDHGFRYITKLPNFILPNGDPLSAVSTLLLVKDFTDGAVEETEGIKTDYTFMSHADVPYLAAKDITEAVNPFTLNSLFYNKDGGLTITTSGKIAGPDSTKHKWSISQDTWLHVHDNIFDPNNWERAEK
jgi:hypothetical protein